MAECASPPNTLLQQVWQQCYRNPLLAREIGLLRSRHGSVHAAAGLVHVALIDTRMGERVQAAESLLSARLACTAAGDALWLAPCDEVKAIGLRRDGNSAAAADLQRELDARTGFERTPMLRFIAHNSRAITAPGRTHRVLD